MGSFSDRRGGKYCICSVTGPDEYNVLVDNNFYTNLMARENLRDAADALAVETEITPFTITDEKDTITNLVNANGGKPVISQRESIEALGWSEDVDKTMQEIQQEGMADIMEPTM